jgi:hypothetical protein
VITIFGKIFHPSSLSFPPLCEFQKNRGANSSSYVALATLAKVYTPNANNPNPSQTDTTALQRHRQVVLECLRDPDISIRRRALDLSFQLVTFQNVRVLTRELLSFLELAEKDMKASTAARICNVAANFRPNRRWEIDTVTRVLRAAGSQVEQDVVNHFVKILGTSPLELQAYATKKLYGILRDETTWVQDGLVLVGIWCLGEYGDLVVGNFVVEKDEEEEDVSLTVTQKDVLDLLDDICGSGYATDEIKEYVVTALGKLSSRFGGNEERIKTTVMKYKANMDVEIQQRAMEFSQLFGLDKETLDALFERIPVLESAKLEDERKGRGEIFGAVGSVSGSDAIQISAGADDLLGMDVSSGGLMDPLKDLLGDSAPLQKAEKPADLLGDIFGSVKSKPVGISCYDKNGLSITLDATRSGDVVTVLINFLNATNVDLSGLMFQVAVPKSMKLQILPPSSTLIRAGEGATQTIKIANPTKVCLFLVLKRERLILVGGHQVEVEDWICFEWKVD